MTAFPVGPAISKRAILGTVAALTVAVSAATWTVRSDLSLPSLPTAVESSESPSVTYVHDSLTHHEHDTSLVHLEQLSNDFNKVWAEASADRNNRIVVSVPGMTLADAQQLIGRSAQDVDSLLVASPEETRALLAAASMPPNDPKSISGPYATTEGESFRVVGLVFGRWTIEQVLGRLLMALIVIGGLIGIEHARRDWSRGGDVIPPK